MIRFLDTLIIVLMLTLLVVVFSAADRPIAKTQWYDEQHDTPLGHSPNLSITDDIENTGVLVDDSPAPQVFSFGDEVTCIYPAILSWDDGSEYLKPMGLKCVVLADNEYLPETVNADCSAGIELQSRYEPLVKDHKLMPSERWFFSDNCYKATQ